MKSIFTPFYPDVKIHSAYDIDYKRLFEEGYRGVIFDIDNTLVPHGAPATPEAERLFVMLKEIGMKSCLVSNNVEARAEMFNKNIHTNVVPLAWKPGKNGYEKAMKLMNTTKGNTIAVGDQLFTDILGARRAGIKSFLTDPIDPAEEIQIKFKRYLENFVMLFYKGPEK
jgi:HAD superfamily phosphatase (TIGR01668 family)